MNSKIVFGQYYNSNSWLHRLDPRVKIISLIVLMVAIFLLENILFLLSFFTLTVIVILTSKIPFSKFLKSLKMITFLLLFMFVFQVLFRKTGKLIATFDFTLTITNLIIIIALVLIYFILGKFVKKYRFIQLILVLITCFLIQYYFVSGKIITNYKIDIYEDSLMSASFVFVRIVNILFLSSILTLTTKPTELNQGLDSLLKPLKVFKVNPAIFTMMVAIALRFIPTLINEANKILKAQASRGVDFKEANLKEKVSQIISLIVPMFVIAYRRAIDLSDAMEARGYDPDKERTTMDVLKFNKVDIISLVVISIVTIAIIVIKIVL